MREEVGASGECLHEWSVAERVPVGGNSWSTRWRESRFIGLQQHQHRPICRLRL